jgi:phosphate transport system substrate-binding protein
MKKFRMTILAAIMALSASMAFGQSGKQMLGAGATFPAPIYTKMFDVYHNETGVMVNYQAIGSSGGLKNIKDKVVDFGASDAFVNDADLAKFPAKLIHIPTVLGAVVVTYNLPVSTSLKLTGPVISDIYLGKITSWNDKAIGELNPGVTLPNLAIMPVYRSDGSGTTFNFTAYLNAISPEWKKTVGNSTSVSWPTGQGAAQNSGVAGVVKQTPGSIGYVELAYAIQSKLPVAIIKNSSGNWISPTLSTISAAAAGDMPKDTRILLVNTSASEGYPICAMTWLLVYQEQKYDGRSFAQAESLVKLLWWVTHQGQQYANALDYATLPKAAVASVDTILKSIMYDGKPILK